MAMGEESNYEGERIMCLQTINKRKLPNLVRQGFKIFNKTEDGLTPLFYSSIDLFKTHIIKEGEWIKDPKYRIMIGYFFRPSYPCGYHIFDSVVDARYVMKNLINEYMLYSSRFSEKNLVIRRVLFRNITAHGSQTSASICNTSNNRKRMKVYVAKEMYVMKENL